MMIKMNIAPARGGVFYKNSIGYNYRLRAKPRIHQNYFNKTEKNYGIKKAGSIIVAINPKTGRFFRFNIKNIDDIINRFSYRTFSDIDGINYNIIGPIYYKGYHLYRINY